MENKKQKTVYKLTVCAVMIALASALSLVKVWQMPLGGSVTLCSMVPIVLVGIMYGKTWGFASAFIYSCVQLLFGITISGLFGWGLTPFSLVGAILFDYIIPFTVLGISGFAYKKSFGVICGCVALSVAMRFVSHFISGWIFLSAWSQWDNIPLYSLCYNGAYMLPELIITGICAALVFKSNALKRIAGI